MEIREMQFDLPCLGSGIGAEGEVSDGQDDSSA